MPWAFPKPRLSLRMLIVLVASSAIAIWAGLFFLSPTRRFTRQLQAQQPAYLRREAAIGLGYGFPTLGGWGSDRRPAQGDQRSQPPGPRMRCGRAGCTGEGRSLPFQVSSPS